MKMNTYNQLIRRPTKLSLTGRSKSSNYNDEKEGLCIPPISIGARSIAYVRQEVEAVIQARIEGKSTEQIKAIVLELINQRTKSV